MKTPVVADRFLADARVLLVPLRTHAGRFRARSICALVCLPAAIASVLVGLTPRPAAAASTVYSQIKTASRAPFVRLHLSDGVSLQGTFAGFFGDWSDSVASVSRYESWRATRPSSVPRLGDPLVLSLTSGDTLRGTFRGVGPRLLLVGQDNSMVLSPVAHDVIAGVHWDAGDSSASWAELRERLLEAPVRVAAVLRYGARTMVVPQEDIVSASGELEDTKPQSSNAPAIIALVAVAGIIIFCVAVAQEANAGYNAFCVHPVRPSTLDRQFGSRVISDRAEPWTRGESIHP